MHDWLDHKDFLELVKTMDLALQVSLTETFNIVSADTINQNIPTVVSPEIRWASSFYKADPHNLQDIIDHMLLAWGSRKKGLHMLNKFGLANYNRHSVKTWKQYTKHS